VPATKIFRHIHHKSDDLLSLVADVEQYPDFIKYLSHSRVYKQREISVGESEFFADVVVSYKFLNETFRSKVSVQSEAQKITVSKPDKSGAVRVLSNVWSFHSLADGSTLIEFDVDVQLKAKPLDMLVSHKFEDAARYIMQCFEERADQLFTRLGPSNVDIEAEIKRLKLV